jgi:hypothetical protein
MNMVGIKNIRKAVNIMKIRTFLPYFTLLVFFSTVQVMASIEDILVTANKVNSYYDADTYVVSFKIKNTGSETVNNVVVVCEIIDGYGSVIRTLTQNAGSLQIGEEYAGKFEYYRADKSFQISHRLLVKIQVNKNQLSCFPVKNF